MKNSIEKLQTKFSNFNFFYDFVKVTGALPTLLWFRPKWVYPNGKQIPTGGVLVSANHKSFLDPVIVHCAVVSRRLNCLATKDLYSNRFWEIFFSTMHCIQVDKDNFSMACLHDVLDRLNDGKAVVIFPEGQVNRDENKAVMTFKSGAVLMAHRSNAPILPVYIVPRKSWLERQYLIIGTPIDVRAIAGEMPSMDDLVRTSEYIRQEELALYTYYQEHFAK